MSSSIDEQSEDKIPHAPITTIEPIYVMTIELDQGKTEQIKVYADSIAEEVSYDFCRKNNLDYQSLTYLKKQIEDLVNEHQLKINSNKKTIIPDSNSSPIQLEAEVQTITQLIQEHQNEYLIKKESSQSHMQTQTEPILNENKSNINNTPSKGTLFSCESFFVSLQERNSKKITKRSQGQKLIHQVKELNHRNDSMKSIRNNVKANTFSVPMNTDYETKINRPQFNSNNHIPHPNKKASNEKIESNQSLLHLKCLDAEQESYISNNNNNINHSHSRLSNKEIPSCSYSKSRKNIGEILYEKGNKLLERKKEKIALMRAELIIKDEEKNTYKPLINSSSSSKRNIKQYSTNNLNNNNNSIINEDLTNRNNHNRQLNCNNTDRQLSIIKKTNSNGNSFITSTPIIPKTLPSNYQKSNKSNHIKSSQFYEEFTYQPHLTDYHLTNQTKLPFSYRQKHFQQKYEQNESKLRDHFNQNIDIKTGQPFFKPILISKQQKRSKTPAIEKDKNIFKDLYSYADYYKVNQSKRKDLIEQEFKRMVGPKISNNTEEIFQRRKECIFMQIFQLFDNDEDGLISIYTIDSNKIQEKIMKIISPIIKDLKEYQGTINREDFVNECNKLFEKLSYQERKQLLEMNKRPKETSGKYSFMPTINKSSKRRLAQPETSSFNYIMTTENGNVL